MTQGRAQGQDRAYQVHCRDLLQYRNPEFAPYSGDGIDVPFDVGGTTWTIGVALKDSDGALLVAECRRRKAAAKQEEIAAFAYKVEVLRRDLGAVVCGAFLTKCAPQLGAVKVGQFEGITVAVLLEGKVRRGLLCCFPPV